MNRKPLSIGVIIAVIACVALLACGGGLYFAFDALKKAVDVPSFTPAPTAAPVATPGAQTPAAPPPTVAGATPVPRATSAPLATPVSDGGGNAATLALLLNTEIKERDQIALTQRLKKVKGPIPTVVNATPPVFKVGDKRTLWVADQPAKKHFTTTATLRYMTAHVYAWTQDGERIDETALKRSIDIFETKIYPTNRQFFGSESSPGIDNDVHVNIFNGYVPGVGGYFSSADAFATVVNEFSNQGEWFYINTRDVRPGTQDYESVLAHEFQHMIHFASDKNEDTWVNEGLSEVAMRLNAYGVGGSDRAFVRDPDIQLDAWRDDPGESVPHYGASYLFNTYFLERFGDKLVQEFVREKANGIRGYDLVLERNRAGVTFEDVFQDWLVANVLNDQTVDKRFAYKDLPAKVRIQQTATNFPYNKTLQVHQFAAQYIDIKPARTGDYTLQLKGDASVHVANADPHSGRFVWYSNRGDDSNMTLTRAFDLRSVSKATLKYWTWYDIEKDYDYAYVEVSSDDGATWDTLESTRTTEANPNGNNFGNGLTGRDRQWVEESLDLTPYAGKQIRLRFEYITDDAFNATGYLLDDIRIPELNYSDDVEGGDGGWQADGFVRVNNLLPQRFSVQMIAFGSKTNVTRIALDANNAAQVPLRNFGGDTVRVLLVISGLTPVTTETAIFNVAVNAP